MNYYLNLKISALFIKIINFYQKYISFDKGLLMVLAPGGACKYQPSCSEYTKTQIKQKGSLFGLFLGLRRVISCR